MVHLPLWKRGIKGDLPVSKSLSIKKLAGVLIGLSARLFFLDMVQDGPVPGRGIRLEVWRAVRAKPLKKLSLFPVREEGRVMGSLS